MILDNSPYGNKTIWGLQRHFPRYFWAGYSLFVLVSSFVGDITILVASIKFGAFKFHRSIVVIIQHIAGCDLLLSVSYVFPNFLTLTADKWVLGNFCCFINTYSGYFFNGVSALLICTMTTCKLLLLKYPLRFGAISSNKAHLLCGASWFTSSIIPSTMLLVDWKDVYFSYRGYQCGYGFTSDVWFYLKPLFAMVFLFTPTCAVVITSGYLLLIAKRVAHRGRENLKWQGITTTILTAILYCLSIIPYIVYRVGESIVHEEMTQTFFNTTLYRISMSIVSLNTISNFFIYSLTVPSFRRFVYDKTQNISSQFFTSRDVNNGIVFYFLFTFVSSLIDHDHWSW